LTVLTDTHALVWALLEPERMSSTARELMSTGEVIASVVNLWELVIKAGRKGSLIDDPIRWWEKYVVHSGIQVLPIRSAHVIALEQLPPLHADPFDRMLIAQATHEGCLLASCDAQIAQYGDFVRW